MRELGKLALLGTCSLLLALPVTSLGQLNGIGSRASTGVGTGIGHTAAPAATPAATSAAPRSTPARGGNTFGLGNSSRAHNGQAGTHGRPIAHGYGVGYQPYAPGQGSYGSPNNLYANSTAEPYGPTRPTIELQTNPRPTFEVPGFNSVQPYSPAGYPATQSFGYGYGYLPLIGGAYTGGLVDSSVNGEQAAATDPDTQNQAAPGNSTDNYRPAYSGAPAAPGAYPYASGPAPGGPYAQPAAPAKPNNGPVTDGLEHPEVTLIFKDGRAPEKVRNYAMTGTTLFVLEGAHQRQIPLSELNLPATQQQNRAEGIDFTPPQATRKP